MNIAVHLLLFCIATYWMATHGIARTFAQVFIPALLFFFLVPQMKLPGLPDLFAFSDVGYPVLVMAYLKRDEIARVKWNFLDLLIAFMMVTPTISVMMNNSPWDGVGRVGELFFKWLMPYLMARVAFFDPEARRLMLKSICICTIIIGCMAAVEARLWPYFVARNMVKLHLAETYPGQVFTRFGLMRAQTTLGHSIDLGTSGMILGGLILTLIPIVGRKWNEPLILAGICGAGAMVVGAVSFTGMFSTLIAFGLMFLFSIPQIGKMLVIPTIIFLMIAMTGFMYHMVSQPVVEDMPEDQVEASTWARVRVAQDSWNFAQKAGYFGQGQYLDTKGMGTGQGSIDNSYMLFVMQFGWIYLIQWIFLALVIGWCGTTSLAWAQTTSERIPVAAILAGIIATFGAMFTVYFGFAYAILTLCLFGCLSTMMQLLTTRQQQVPYAMPAPGMGYSVGARR